jgi:hypothetical protein
MVEGLAILTGVELGKYGLEQVLKPVLEGYVQDFFGVLERLLNVFRL